MKLLLLTIFPVFLLITSCGGNNNQKSTAERLEEVQGKQLSESEINSLLDKGELVCQLSDGVKKQLWQQMDEEQFKFQDYIFEYQCPDQKEFYSTETGRLKTK